MKNTKKILLVFGIFVSMLCFAQSIEIPEAIKQDFSKRFPKVEAAKWIKLPTQYSAHFMFHGVTTAVYSLAGEWQKTEYIVHHDEWPHTIDTNIETLHPGFTVHSAKFVEEGDHHVHYEMNVWHDNDSLTLLFSETGDPIE